jgi:hypothetical protein
MQCLLFCTAPVASCPAGDVQALRLLADAVADASIERLQEVQWDAKDRWDDTPLQVRVVYDMQGILQLPSRVSRREATALW